MNELTVYKHAKNQKNTWLSNAEYKIRRFVQTIRTTIVKIKERREKRKKQYKLLHPVFKAIYKYVSVLLILCFVFSIFLFTRWRINILIEKKAEEKTAIAMNEYMEQLHMEEIQKQNEYLQILQASAETEEKIFNRQVEILAKLAYGIRNFEEKYGYSEQDYMRYFRCVTNRLAYGGYGNTIEEVVNMPDQWVGYHRNNPVVTRYKELAEKFLTEYNSENEPPISSEYRFTVFTEGGLFLAKEFNSQNPYTWYKG